MFRAGFVSLALSFLLVSSGAAAKPWRGIEAGRSTKDEVLKKFGPPTKISTVKGREVLGYFDKQAIEGTTQTQFKVHPQSKQVERIDVFVGPVIKRKEIVEAYGPACPENKVPADAPCYVEKTGAKQKTYLVYPQLGLAVFFRADGDTVETLVFQPVTVTVKPAPPKTPDAGMTAPAR